ncbi:hypothetical protein MNBD_GAMMA15-1813 [hydrothermal vent metagenome]|uniref:ABC transporter substrate-binding protein n=1 Tax=hydrothermal vent metagenome TaxID=652676 RepID=A0A3B0Y3H6_9ZZZZ
MGVPTFRRMLQIYVFITLAISWPGAEAAKCLLIMSYHKGYAWNDGIEKGVEETLRGKCELKKFYMDTKRNTHPEFAKKKALEAKSLIEEYRPDIVIASDDNASRYLVSRYYKDSSLPFVFCGVNWTADEYGYPYRNVTGMVEVAPILPLLKIIKQTVNPALRGVYLSADVVTEHKDYVHYKKEYEKRNIRLTAYFVRTMDEWEEKYTLAQSADFIIVNNYAGIADWDARRAIRHVRNYSKTFTVTNYKWMMPYAMFALTKNAHEQGVWAARVALNILEGSAPYEIPVTVNKEWNMLVNPELLDIAGIEMNKRTLRRASRSW